VSVTRRQFILGTAAGLILPSYYDKVFAFFENHGEPLIEVPKHADLDMYAVGLGLGDYQFNLGMPLLETLTLAKKLGMDPEILIIGIQPNITTFKIGLSNIIEKKSLILSA